MVTTALVLSAGGMFGAYQAGAWKALAPVLRPDLVVGTSAGAINGWAIAGGCTPEEIIEMWLDPPMAEMMRVRWRRSSWRGLWDPAPLERAARRLCERCRPQIPFALTVTEAPRMRARIVRGEEVTWRHIAAACAVPCGFPAVRIEGKLYVDGGLLGVLPVWAAAELGATRAVAVNVLPVMPSRVVRTAARLAYRLGPGVPATQNLEIFELRPSQPLGRLKDAIRWKAENARRWIEMGEREAGELVQRLARERVVPLL